MNIGKKYKATRLQTVDFCKHLHIEDYAVQVVQFASPPKWHLAHTTWFFETFILIPYSNNYIPFNANFNFLFNSYYNNVGDRILQTNRGNMSRPTTGEIYEYRAYVDAIMLELLTDVADKEIIDLVILGLNHEQQHQELLITDVKYMLGAQCFIPGF